MSFSFGTSTPGFGSQPTPNLSLGVPAATQPLQFGAPAPTQPLQFGAPAPTQPLQFGAPASTQPLQFGAPASTQPLQFGAPASTGLTSTTSTSGLFGAASTAPPGGLTFGAQSNTTFGQQAPQIGFGTPASTALSFGASTAALPTSSTLNFGATATPQLNSGFSFSPAANTGLSFGTSTAAPKLNFGSTLTTPASTGTAGVVTASSAPVGLGGIASSTPSQDAASSKAEQAPKEQQIPNEIQQTVDHFKNFVKQQKSYSSDVARCSVKDFRIVENDIDSANNLLNDVENQLLLNKSVAEKLKYDTAKGLQHIEIAQRTSDTPIGLQYDNTAPLNYFIDLVDTFEKEMLSLKMQIENTDKYVKNVGNTTPLSSQDLALGLRRIHETFVALAGRLQSVHTQVEAQKEQYLNFRSHMFSDHTNVFEKAGNNTIQTTLNRSGYLPPTISTGPTPFNSMSHPSVVQAELQHSMAQTQQNSTFSGFQPQSSLNLNTPNKSLFGTTGFGQTFGSSPSNTSFQLQKPPSGNKRWKQ